MPPIRTIDRRIPAGGPRTYAVPAEVPAEFLKPTSTAAQKVRPDLSDILPPLHVINVYASEILVPALTSFGGANDRVSAWYGMESIRVDQDTGEQLALCGYQLELLPPDQAGAGTSPSGGTVTAWGTTRGDAAAIVIGQDLPIAARKAWSFAPCYVPGLEVETSTPSLDSPQRTPTYIAYHTFPTGKYTDTTPNKLVLPRSFLPALWPIPRGARLDVAFVVRRTQLTGGVAGNTSGAAVKALIGHISVQLAFVKTQRSALWNR